MGSTGDADRKRRHLSSVSPTAATAKKPTFAFFSEDRKLNAAVLQYQNQKLAQKLEVQRVEYFALENKFAEVKEKQKSCDATLEVVGKSWVEVVNDFESCSLHTREYSNGRDGKCTPDGAASSPEQAFLSRLVESGATQSSSAASCPSDTNQDEKIAHEKIKNILYNTVAAIDDIWYLKDRLHGQIMKVLQDGSCRALTSNDLMTEVKNLRLALNGLHLYRKSVVKELLIHYDIDAKNKAEMRHVRGELEKTVAELEETNTKLENLRAERDMTKGTFFPILNVGSKHVAVDRIRDKQKELQDMESALKELLEQSSGQLVELKGLYEERIKILRQLPDLQNKLKNVKCISSSEAYLSVRGQLEKLKSEVVRYQALYEKLQIEKDNLFWKEKELALKNDIVEVYHRSSGVAESRMTDLRLEIQKQIEERKMIEMKLGEASKERGRKEIIAEFKALVSSFPQEMTTMQSQLGKYKEAAADIHSLRADVRSLSSILERKVKECKTLSARSCDQVDEIQKLQSMVRDLNESDLQLKLILEMYRREAIDSRDVLEARDREYKAWAHVQMLKSSLDERKLESRVKTAIEAEASSQQTLATTEAEIADLRQKLETSRREISRFSDNLKSKNEDIEAYLSEIETIGQAYDDMQTQNQHLLQQITERDDYNIKLVLEAVKARQVQDALAMDKQNIEREIQRANASFDFYGMKAFKIEDQLRIWSEQLRRLTEDRHQSSVTLESFQKRLLDVGRSSQQVRESLEESQSKVNQDRAAFMELQIELERERFEKNRTEEELDAVRRKILHLQAQTEGLSIVQKLRQELREYREILKCSICLDRLKEVVITKCYHLFCNRCVQRITETRHRKCPKCGAGFGTNDVKPVYM